MPKQSFLSLPPDQRRRAFKAELKNSLKLLHGTNITEKALLEKYFDDPTGQRYWEYWLTGEHEDLGSFVELLAAHNAKNNLEGRSDRDLRLAFINRAFERPIYRAIIDAAKRGEIWLHGDTSPLCSGLFENSDFSRFILGGKIEVDRRAMTCWLLADPNYEYLVPKMAALFLNGLSLTNENSVVAKAAKTKGRGPGTGFAKLDRKLFDEIKNILEAGKAQGAFGAALKIADKIAGEGTPESRARRVANLYNADRKKLS
ncbi:hypothetical protein MKK88_16285 [Methylobacterium sp. E-005]|uniref:hypothetical protein n=1 Tax=Methylobacterium sp. E-005 TaxID=2836549 RepID=UPI001FB8C456|nr:hypothetical protein [Methylobacterium sp. E-005]MCJ2087528.1 hypothetical protein [Methylobacterium sp. E-005]